MTPENFERIVLERKLRKPFTPFALALHDGTQIEVDEPLAITWRDGHGAVFPLSGSLIFFDVENVSQIIDTAPGKV